MKITLTQWGEHEFRLNVWSKESGEREFSFTIRRCMDWSPNPSEECPEYYSYLEYFVQGHTMYVLYAEGRGGGPPDELIPLYHFLRPYLELEE